jgi:hypothetical protein
MRPLPAPLPDLGRQTEACYLWLQFHFSIGQAF